LVAVSSCPAIFNADNPMNFNETHYITIEGLRVPGRHIRPFEIFDRVQAGAVTMPQFVKTCCAMLANTAYESVKDKNDQSPEFEFFRHIRNASSHQNRFFFKTTEPARPATWRDATIDHTVKGSHHPLQGLECFGSYLGAADLIDLIADIEVKLVP
jgi:hypothetical protein